MKNLILVLLVAAALTACGKTQINIAGTDGAQGTQGEQGTQGIPGLEGIAGADGLDGLDGSSCSATQVEGGAKIFCTDGTQAFIRNGADGKTCTVQKTKQGATVKCGTDTVFISNGTNGTNGQDGLNGVNGVDGEQGEAGKDGIAGLNGQDGSSCSITDTNGGALVSCGDETVLIKDGMKGATGTQGEPGTSVPDGASLLIAVINPCGDAPGIYDEIVFVDTDGHAYAYYEDNADYTSYKDQNRRIIEIPVNTYLRTTDGDNCKFKLDGGANLIFESHTY